MADIHPYTVKFPEDGIAELKQRLGRSIYPNELEQVGWDLGAPLDNVQHLAKHWRTEFDFQKAEAHLNQLPQFITPIKCEGFDALNIHFVHSKSKVPGAIPLFFSHGWPGSFIEVSKIIKLLNGGENGAPAFHVVAPSLPNYGFSEGPKRRGFAIEQYAETCNKLMQKLGYETYAAQGGDWGWYVVRAMSLLYPKSCLATHFNMDVGDPPQELIDRNPKDRYALPDHPTPRETKGIKRTQWFDDDGFGYNLLQSTKPQTLAYSLSDSPIGLLRWIYEKLHDWTDSYPWTDDEICTWVSIYWFSTAGPGAACRIYYEMNHDKNGKFVPRDALGEDFEGAVSGRPKATRKWLNKNHGTGVKIGQTHFPNDIHVLPSAWTRTIGDVVFENEHESGGHFAAWEKPQELVNDLRSMFAQGSEAAQLWP